MRLLRAISDLPWWTGLPIYFLGNFLTEGNLFFFSIGIIMCLFGSWVFSKLLNYKESHVTFTIIGIPVFIFMMKAAADLGDSPNYTSEDAFVFKAMVGLFLSLIAISGFKRN